MRILYAEHFKRAFEHLDSAVQLRALKLMEKIKAFPEIGKPMMNDRKGTREVYLSPFRLAYAYVDATLIFIKIYHKDEQ